MDCTGLGSVEWHLQESPWLKAGFHPRSGEVAAEVARLGVGKVFSAVAGQSCLEIFEVHTAPFTKWRVDGFKCF